MTALAIYVAIGLSGLPLAGYFIFRRAGLDGWHAFRSSLILLAWSIAILALLVLLSKRLGWDVRQAAWAYWPMLAATLWVFRSFLRRRDG